MDTKTCFKCGRTLPRSEFYRHVKMTDGLLGKCKECTRVDSQKNRLFRIDKYRENDRVRNGLGDRKLAMADKQRKKRKSMGAAYNKAHRAVANAIRSGALSQPDHCQRCLVQGAPQAHHDDHAKPLEVMWLCSICHAARHVELGRVKKITFLKNAE